ncbi:MAG: radical SAM protein [Clostridium sp.]|uniref:radical SAM protein n=1 Tax=Clostridium sp. TaxID=1506 RepID=UPI0039E90784
MSENLSLKEVIEKYNDVSPFVIIKIDVQRRGVIYTENALKVLDPDIHDVKILECNDRGLRKFYPSSLLLRDGTTIMTGKRINGEKPYIVDYIDGKLVITDNGEFIEEVEYWTKADFLTKFTSKGTPMSEVAVVRPQRIDFDPYRYCHFWDNGHGCRYCSRGGSYYKNRSNQRIKLNPEDAYETVKEALKQRGRYTSIHLTGGSNTGGQEVFDEEVDWYIEILQAIGRNFKTKRFPSQLIASAFNERQLAKIYENTGIATYTTDIEVLNEEKFNWICPGKAEWVGYKEWKRRLISAVDIFGKGNVNTGTVGGVELAKPYGFLSEDEALKAILEEAEDLAQHGVGAVYIVWGIGPNSAFQNQQVPSLEYFTRLARGYSKIHSKYNLSIDNDTYRNCGNHPDTDLDRVK